MKNRTLKGMIEYKFVILVSCTIIFTSVFFIHFIFNNYFSISELCIIRGGDLCTEEHSFFYFLFSFLQTVSFMFIIETTIYLMFKHLETQTKLLKTLEKRMKDDIASLQRRKGEIEAAKKEAQKRYLKRELSEKAFESLKDRYDTEAAETESKIQEKRRKEGGG